MTSVKSNESPFESSHTEIFLDLVEAQEMSGHSKMTHVKMGLRSKKTLVVFSLVLVLLTFLLVWYLPTPQIRIEKGMTQAEVHALMGKKLTLAYPITGFPKSIEIQGFVECWNLEERSVEVTFGCDRVVVEVEIKRQDFWDWIKRLFPTKPKQTQGQRVW